MTIGMMWYLPLMIFPSNPIDGLCGAGASIQTPDRAVTNAAENARVKPKADASGLEPVASALGFNQQRDLRGSPSFLPGTLCGQTTAEYSWQVD